MPQFTIELDEMVCKWLKHISELTGRPVENLISSGICNLMITFEDNVFKAFADSAE